MGNEDFIFGTLASAELRAKYLGDSAGGVRHDYRVNPNPPREGDCPTATVTCEAGLSVARVRCEIIEPARQSIEFTRVDIKWNLINWAYFDIWEAELPSFRDGDVVRYHIEAETIDGQTVAADEGESYSFLVGEPSKPAWIRDAIVYQIMPDRFALVEGLEWTEQASMDDIHGGTIRGIIERIDYLHELGVNCIWLTPIFPDKSHHGYHATDYFSVNPRLGTSADMHELVRELHARDMRVILDFAANHFSRQHPSFVEAQKDRNSKYHDWFHWTEWPRQYETFFGVKELPRVNVSNPDARKYLLDAARYWLEEYGVDGYRLDYALGPSLDFWTDFRQVVKRANPQAWIFGEGVHSPETLLNFRGRFDGMLDFQMMDSLRRTFAYGTMTIAEFEAFLERHENYFPESFDRPNFLDNHDLNRFLWAAGDDKQLLKLAALCQFTLASQPIIYYGTEVGLSHERDIVWPDGRHVLAEARQPMVWDGTQDLELLAYYRYLIGLRKRHPVIRSGQRKTVHLDGARSTWVYTLEDGHERLLIALNLSREKQSIDLDGMVVELNPLEGRVVDLTTGGF